MKYFFRGLHILWGALGVYASYVIATGGGHPPGVIFLPVVLLVWGAGHCILWFMHKMADHGDAAGAEIEPEVQKSWPLSVAIVAVLLGIIFAWGIFMGLAVPVAMIYSQGVRLEAIIPRALLWLPFAFGFIGLLRRQLWSRYAIASGALLFAGLYLFRIVVSLSRSTRAVDWGDLAFALSLELVLLAVGVWALRSSQLSGFLRLGRSK